MATRATATASPAKITAKAKAKAKAITSLASSARDRGLALRALGARTAVGATLLVGGAGAVVAVQGHGGEPVLRARQTQALAGASPVALRAREVEAFVAKAPEPVQAARRTPPAATRCAGRGPGPLRDPWSCAIRYRSGTIARYRVVVAPNGSYKGVGAGIIEGCCLAVPTLD